MSVFRRNTFNCIAFEQKTSLSDVLIIKKLTYLSKILINKWIIMHCFPYFVPLIIKMYLCPNNTILQLLILLK